jgi:hypothetical protein
VPPPGRGLPRGIYLGRARDVHSATQRAAMSGGRCLDGGHRSGLNELELATTCLRGSIAAVALSS